MLAEAFARPEDAPLQAGIDQVQPVLGFDIAQRQRDEIALRLLVERIAHVVLGQQVRQLVQALELEIGAEGIALEQRMALRQAREDFDDGRDDTPAHLGQGSTSASAFRIDWA